MKHIEYPEYFEDIKSEMKNPVDDVEYLNSLLELCRAGEASYEKIGDMLYIKDAQGKILYFQDAQALKNADAGREFLRNMLDLDEKKREEVEAKPFPPDAPWLDLNSQDNEKGH